MSIAVEAEAITTELFRTSEARRDPYPRLHRLRSIAPVHRSPGMHCWVVTSYEECRSALRDPRFGKDFAASLDRISDTWREHESLAQFSRMMVQLDAPEHTRLRKRVARTFTASRIHELRPVVEATVADLLEQAASGEVDLLDTLAFTLPITVIGDLLGMPREDLADFRQPALDMTAGLEVRVSPEARERADAAVRFLDDYFTDLIARRRDDPGDDLVSALATDDGPDPLTDRELKDLLALLFVAGFETTTNVISGGLVAMHEQPEQLALLRAGLADLDHVEDELLRHQASLQLVNRVALEDVELGGQVIPAGDTVLLMLGAANRDPAVFDDPDRLDFSRPRPKHLTFGGGIHHCLGAALARMELEVLLEAMGARFDRVELTTGEQPVFRDTLAFRAAESLPLRLRSTTDAPAGPCPVTGARPGGEGADDAAWRDEQRRLLEQAPPELTPAALAERVALLEAQPLFASCRASELVSLASTAYVLTFEPGEALVEQGASSDDTFLLFEGEADVTIDGTLVATVGPDDLVGERGVVTGTPRAATVTATTHLAAYVISRARLAAVLEGNPTAAATMLAVTAARYPAHSTVG